MQFTLTIRISYLFIWLYISQLQYFSLRLLLTTALFLVIDISRCDFSMLTVAHNWLCQSRDIDLVLSLFIVKYHLLFSQLQLYIIISQLRFHISQLQFHVSTVTLLLNVNIISHNWITDITKCEIVSTILFYLNFDLISHNSKCIVLFDLISQLQMSVATIFHNCGYTSRNWDN